MDRTLAEYLEGFSRDVGRSEFVRVPHQDAGHVHRHVAVADDRDAPGRGQVEAAILEVGMAVVPADELGCRVNAGQVFARNPHLAVGFVAGGVDDVVVVPAEVVDRNIAAEFDVAEEAETLMLRGAVVDPDDVLDLLVIGSDAAAHQTERSGKAVEQVDMGLDAVRLEQRGDRVEAARTGADHGDAERSFIAPEGPVFEGLLHSFLAFSRRGRGSRLPVGDGRSVGYHNAVPAGAVQGCATAGRRHLSTPLSV